MGRRRKGRALDGILLFDKPSGLSSNQALQRVRWLYGAAKAGHTGSLDPLATGMLPICFGETTKLSGQLLDSDKTYRVSFKLGEATDTGDSDGEIIQRSSCAQVDATALQSVLAKFIGEIEQIPPMYSALKHQGKRLYELARQGEEVERKPRQISIYAIYFLSLEAGVGSLEVSCSKGTYIRTLIEDIAVALDTHAHVTALRRIKVGPFDQAMHTDVELEALRENSGQAGLDALLLPSEAALQGWPEVKLSADDVFYFRRGQAIQVLGVPQADLLAAFGPERELLGLARIDDQGRVAPKRLLEAKPKTP